jgi:hypothetical protein
MNVVSKQQSCTQHKLLYFQEAENKLNNKIFVTTKELKYANYTGFINTYYRHLPLRGKTAILGLELKTDICQNTPGT